MTHSGKLWIVAMDGEHARIVVPTDRARTYRTIQDLTSGTAHLRSADLGSDVPGRSFESANPTRHALEPRTDPHRKSKLQFAQEIAAVINAAADNGEFDRLVLAAPAHALHDVRNHLSHPATSRIAACVQKDLVKTPDAELADHLPSDTVLWGTMPGAERPDQ